MTRSTCLVHHVYANADDVELGFGHEGPVNPEMQLKTYDVDDGGAHYVFFMHDAQPARPGTARPGMN